MTKASGAWLEREGSNPDWFTGICFVFVVLEEGGGGGASTLILSTEPGRLEGGSILNKSTWNSATRTKSNSSTACASQPVSVWGFGLSSLGLRGLGASGFSADKRLNKQTPDIAHCRPC